MNEHTNTPQPVEHRPARDAGMNRRCTCGAEYTWAANLFSHIKRENEKAAQR